MFQLFFAVIALAAASIHLAVSKTSRRDQATTSRTVLLYFLFIYVGVMGVFTAYAHVFRPLQTSASIGWSPSPYEYEVGMADFAIGVLGILCVWIRGNFWLATAIANFIWLVGDAIGHLRQMLLYGNQAANNSGIFPIIEIIMPLAILLLALYNHRRSE